MYLLPIWIISKAKTVTARHGYWFQVCINHPFLKTTRYMVKATFIYFSAPSAPLPPPPRHTHTHTLKTLEHQTHKKLITESYFFKTAISYPFFRNTGWDVVQNDNNLRYHKDHKKNQYNCIETPASKSQIYWLISV